MADLYALRSGHARVHARCPVKTGFHETPRKAVAFHSAAPWPETVQAWAAFAEVFAGEFSKGSESVAWVHNSKNKVQVLIERNRKLREVSSNPWPMSTQACMLALPCMLTLACLLAHLAILCGMLAWHLGITPSWQSGMLAWCASLVRNAGLASAKALYSLLRG
jgi:hypothetical protein